MTAPDAQAPRGEFLPPAPTAPDGNGAGSQDASAHAIAEAPARAAAAGRVRVHAGTAEPAAADYTGLVTRAIGFGIDAVIIDLAAILVVAIVALALTLFKVPSRIDTALAALAAAVFIVWAAAYFVAFWSTTGQTPGARIMRFRVLAPDAMRGHLSPRRALLRLLGHDPRRDPAAGGLLHGSLRRPPPRAPRPLGAHRRRRRAGHRDAGAPQARAEPHVTAVGRPGRPPDGGATPWPHPDPGASRPPARGIDRSHVAHVVARVSPCRHDARYV